MKKAIEWKIYQIKRFVKKYTISSALVFTIVIFSFLFAINHYLFTKECKNGWNIPTPVTVEKPINVNEQEFTTVKQIDEKEFQNLVNQTTKELEKN